MSCTWSRRRKDSGKAILARPWPGLSQLKLYIPMHSTCNTRLIYWNAMLRIMRRQQSVSVLCEYTIAHLFQLLYLLLFQSHQFPESTYGAVAGDQLPNKCPQKWEWNYAGTRVLCKNVQAPNSGGTAQHIHAHHLTADHQHFEDVLPGICCIRFIHYLPQIKLQGTGI